MQAQIVCIPVLFIVKYCIEETGFRGGESEEPKGKGGYL